MAVLLRGVAARTTRVHLNHRQTIRFDAHKATLRVKVRASLYENMADSVTVSAIPPGFPIVAAYINGLYTNYAEMVLAFPKAYILGVTVTPNVAAQAFDCEWGNGVPADCPGWWHLAVAAGWNLPVIYCPGSWVDLVVNAMTAAGIRRDEYIIWSAHYGVGQHICGPNSCRVCTNTANLTQWVDHGQPPDGQGNYDQSIVPVGLLTPAPIIPPVNPPPPPEEDEMTFLAVTPKAGQPGSTPIGNVGPSQVWQVSGIWAVHLPNPGDLGVLEALFGPQQPLSTATVAAYADPNAGGPPAPTRTGKA